MSTAVAIVNLTVIEHESTVTKIQIFEEKKRTLHTDDWFFSLCQSENVNKQMYLRANDRLILSLPTITVFSHKAERFVIVWLNGCCWCHF